MFNPVQVAALFRCNEQYQILLKDSNSLLHCYIQHAVYYTGECDVNVCCCAIKR